MPEAALAGPSAGMAQKPTEKRTEKVFPKDLARFTFEGKGVVEAPHHLGNEWRGLPRSWNLGTTGGANHVERPLSTPPCDILGRWYCLSPEPN